MAQNHSAPIRQKESQFSLAALFEFATLCAVLSALFRAAGGIASVFLMAMALALGARQGLLTVIMFMAASVAADVSAGGIEQRDTALQRQATVILIASLLCGWYVLRRRFFRRSELSEVSSEPDNISNSGPLSESDDDQSTRANRQ